MDGRVNALHVKHLNKSFKSGLGAKRKSVLKDVNFSVLVGTITGFVGVNGSGKTTSIKCLLRFIFPDSHAESSIEFFGKADFDLSVKKRIGYFPERPYLPEHLTAEEFLTLHWILGGGKNDKALISEMCTKVLTRVNLPGVEKSLLRGFSKGMLQRVGLAQALLHQPDFLILDEPMSGLDPDGRRIVKNIIREEHQRGATIFFSSHLLADMDELCSHLVVIDQGKIHFSGPVENFTQVENLESLISFLDKNMQRHQIRVSKDELQNKISDILMQGNQILRISPMETNIESVFTQRKWLESQKLNKNENSEAKP